MEAVTPAAWPEFGQEGWEGAEAQAVACEAVEFEDLFANPIAEGANLEFRVSRAPEEEDKEEEVMDLDVFERVAKSEIVMEDDQAPSAAAEEEVKAEEAKVEETGDALNRLETQAKLVNAHVDELQRIVALQSSLTGANPLAQELASAVLGTKEGKVVNTLSPETVKYLQSVFAVKDTLTKKEARELGLISGATLTQVRDFFAMQKSRVRSVVEQFTDEAEPRSDEIGDAQLDEILAKDVGFSKLTDVESVESLLEKMRQEKLLPQQEKLLQVILRTEQGLILRRFLEKGGLKVLCTWLIAAAAEQQTTLLRQLLHVLSHLPMSHAIPLQVSSLLQPVNKLRFYFIQDVANHARILMSKWSNIFMNKVEGVTSVDSENLDVSRKRGRDSSVTKRFEGGLPKTKAGESVKGQFDLPRATVRSVSSGGTMKVPVLALAASKAAGGQIAKSSTVSEDSPNYNTSNIKAVAALQHNFRKVVPSKGARQPQISMISRLPETGAMDESAANQAPSGGARNSLSGPSPSSTLTSSQAPKARGASATDEGSKVKGAVKVAAAMSTIRSSSTFPVSEAANFATPVSRKHALGDQQKEKRRLLPVEDSGNGNRWRESTARRPVIEVGKTSRPLSADEIRKAKFRARIMQMPTASNSNHKHLSAQEPLNSRGKPTPVGDGWSLDRYATMDGGDRSIQDGSGASLPRPVTSNVDYTSVPRQILDEKTFDQLVAEEAAEAAKAKVSSFEPGINTGRSPVYEQGAESIGHLSKASLPEGNSIVDSDTDIQQATAIDVDSQPLSPSIAEALCESFSETEAEVAEDIGVMNDPLTVSAEGPVVDIVAEDAVMEQAPVESGSADVIPTEPVKDKVIEASLIPWVVPPVLNLNSGWGVVAGDASKELGFQAARVKREEEEVYSDSLPIPDNPKDLWDEEALYDDTLTPEIPIEVLEISASSKASSPTAVVNQAVDYNPLMPSSALPAAAKILGEPPIASSNPYAGGAQQMGDAGAGHDPNLLALLLSNPHLVSQLANSQQKGDGSLAGLSALLALGSVASQSAAATPAQVNLGQPTINSNLPAAMQPQVANIGHFQGGQAIPMPFPETNAARPEASGPPSWDAGAASSWALPTPPAPPPPPPPSLPSNTNNHTSVPPPPPPPPQQQQQEFGYNGSFQQQKSQQAYTWAPLNTVMHASPNPGSQGRGRLPVMSHNVTTDVVADEPPPPPVFASGWSSNVHQQHNVQVPTWAHSEVAMDYQQQQQQQRWARPPPSSSSLPTLPLPPYPPQPQPQAPSQPAYWQPNPPPYRQECRPHHPSAPPQWHPSQGPNYGHNPR